MSIRLRELYEKTKSKFKLKLISGADGLDCIVSWVYQIEDINVSDFLYGSELVISTCFASSKEGWFKELMERMAGIGVSGIILNTGSYLKADKIPQEVIDCSEKYGIPVFTMPWEMHIVELIRDYCGRIFASEKIHEKLNSALKNILFSETPEESSFRYLERNSMAMNETYFVADIEMNLEHSSQVSHEFGILNEKEVSIINFFNHHFKKWNLLYEKERCIVLIQNEKKERIIRAFQELSEKAKWARIGFGEEAKGLLEIKNAQKMADAALRFAIQKKSPMEDYSKMGISQILMLIHDSELLKKYSMEILGKLMDYDKENHTELIQTLKAYISYSGSVQKAAEETFTHRNTINYRVKKIKEITGKDLENYEELFQLYFAFQIKDIIL